MNEDTIVREITLIDKFGILSLSLFLFAIIIGLVSISLRKSRVNIFSSYLLCSLFLFVLYSVCSFTGSVFDSMAHDGRPDFIMLFDKIARVLNSASLIFLGIGVGGFLVGGSFLFSKKK